jgi:hypothetical protein
MGPEGLPTLDRQAVRADRIVIATVRILDAGFDASFSPVDLIVERTIVSDSLGALPDTIRSFMYGGSSTFEDSLGRGRLRVEEEVFNDCKCDGMRCLLLLRLESHRFRGITSRPLYRPVGGDLQAVFPISEGDTVRNVQLQPGRVPVLENLPLAECLKRILAARAAPRAAPRPVAPRK